MVKKIFWTDFAKEELRKNFNYLKENAGQRVARKETQKLLKQPKDYKPNLS